MWDRVIRPFYFVVYVYADSQNQGRKGVRRMRKARYGIMGVALAALLLAPGYGRAAEADPPPPDGKAPLAVGAGATGALLAPGLDSGRDWPRLAQTESGEGTEAEGGEGAERMHLTTEPEEKPWREPFFTRNKLHKYLGLGSMACAIAAAVSAPESEGGPVSDEKGFHHYAAKTAAGLGGAAIGTGLVFHWKDFSFRDGLLDPDILHMLLGTLGTAGYVIAVNSAPDAGHASAGMIGGAAMLLSIKIAW